VEYSAEAAQASGLEMNDELLERVQAQWDELAGGRATYLQLGKKRSAVSHVALLLEGLRSRPVC
jgi:hypothetical protein